MFGKKETFKYEVEVNALIREATNNINQRVLALELQNNQLIIQNQKLEYDLNTLRHTIYTDVQRLEKRITDFTDLWHPIMTENMNRIKTELETTIKQAEREDIQKISFDLENKLTKIVEDNGLMNNVLVGYYNQLPIFINKNCNVSDLIKCLKQDRNDYQSSSRILDSLKHCKNVYYDPSVFQHLKVINQNCNILYKNLRLPHENIPIENIIQQSDIINIYKLCKEYGIKFVINGQDRVNGVPLKMLFEDE